MKKLSYLIVLTLILGLVLTGCTLLSNIGQVPTSEQSGIAYLTKGPSSDLVGLWHFDGNADDSSVHGNSGTLHNFVMSPSPWVSGVLGQALSFNGVDSYVSVDDDNILDITDKLTIEAWIVADVIDTYKSIVVKGDAFTEGIINYGLQIQAVDNEGTLRFFVYDGGIYKFVDSTSQVLADGQWYHVAVTVDTTAGIVEFYIDGSPAGTSTFTASLPVSTSTLEIGRQRHTSGASQYFEGIIDEVRIWNVALSQAQIGDVTPPVVTITAPDNGGCYQTDTLPTLAYVVTDLANPSPGAEVTTGWSTDEGVHTVTVTATDGAGNIGSDSVTYTVDNTNPVVTITAPADGGFYPVGAVPALASTVTDNLDPAPVVDDTGYSTDPGEHTVTVTATDCAGNEGSDSVTYYVLENFVTGGGNIKDGKKVALTFAGTVGVIEDVFTVGQFQIVDHIGLFYDGKGAESWHCNNFTYLVFSGESAESPAATNNTAIFEGEFTSNRGGTEMLKLRIVDNDEPGAGVDTFSIWFFDDWVVWTIDGGNFQVHDIED